MKAIHPHLLLAVPLWAATLVFLVALALPAQAASKKEWALGLKTGSGPRPARRCSES